jgi:hypothetical protein
MRPPDCYVCHLMLHEVPDDSRDYFTLVRFGATEDTKMAPSRAMEAAGRTGHHYNALWFCNEHLPLGREHADRDLHEALAAIKADPRYLVSRTGRPEGRARPGTNGRLHPVPGQVLAALARALDVTASPRRAMAAAAALRGLVERATTRRGHRAGSARPRPGGRWGGRGTG